MEDNYLNDRLRDSMDTPRDIPYDGKQWDALAARLDAVPTTLPTPKTPFAWHRLAYLALIPLLAWNVWLQSRLQQVSNAVTTTTKTVAKIDTLTTQHKIVVYDTIYHRVVRTTYINKIENIFSKNNIQNTDNQVFKNKEKLSNDVNNNTDIVKNDVKNKASKNILVDINTPNKVNQSGVEDLKKSEKSSIHENEVVKNKAENTTTNATNTSDTAVKTVAETAAQVPATSEIVAANPTADSAQIKAETPVVAEIVAAPKATIKKVFEDDEPIKIKPARSKMKLTTDAVSIDFGTNIFGKFDENSIGASLQIGLSPSWKILTGFQFAQRNDQDYKDSLPKTFPKPDKNGHEFAHIERNTFTVPLTLRWYPNINIKYIKPYVSIGSSIDVTTQSGVRYGYKDPNKPKDPAQEGPKDDVKIKPAVFGLANIGVEAKVYKKFSIFTQAQYRVAFNQAEKIKTEQQNIFLQGGVKYYFR